MMELDHLVVAARTLEEGAAWLEARLGVAPGAGGKHAAMGTHNRLLSLGPGSFLEVIAIDPDAPPISRPRWFGLDEPAMAERLARGPALIHWVVRTDDIGRAIAAIFDPRPEILQLERGPYRWRIGVAADGRLAHGGTLPTAIQWEGPRPQEALADSGCRLEWLLLRHPRAAHTLRSLRLAGLDPAAPVEPRADGAGLEALIRTPSGLADLPE